MVQVDDNVNQGKEEEFKESKGQEQDDEQQVEGASEEKEGNDTHAKLPADMIIGHSAYQLLNDAFTDKCEEFYKLEATNRWQRIRIQDLELDCQQHEATMDKLRAEIVSLKRKRDEQDSDEDEDSSTSHDSDD